MVSFENRKNSAVSGTLETVYCIFESFNNVSVLRLNALVNNFSVMSGRSHRFLGITSTVGE